LSGVGKYSDSCGSRDGCKDQLQNVLGHLYRGRSELGHMMSPEHKGVNRTLDHRLERALIDTLAQHIWNLINSAVHC